MQNLKCNQVSALLTFFVEEKLNPKLMQSMEYHINICPNCREKYLNLVKIFENCDDVKNNIIQDESVVDSTYKEKQYQLFKENLSAYIDNELSDEENLRIRKISIANENARQDLKDILFFRELLKESFYKTKNNLKDDFCEPALNKLYLKHPEQVQSSKYISIAYLVICIVLIFAICKFLT